MKQTVVLGLFAAVVVLGCSSSGDDDDTQSGGTGGATQPAAGSGGGAPMGSGGAAVTGSGGKPAMTGGSGSGGVAAAGTGGAGSGGMGGTGGTVAVVDGGTITMPPSTFKPPCITAGKDLVLIGDSYVNYTERLEPRLTEHAHTDGALAATDAFVDFAVPGTSLANCFLCIPPQWDSAKATMPKFVVMDGGGNDILLGNPMCLDDGVGKETDPSCMASVNDGREVAHDMIESMKASGVSKVLYFFYPNVPAGGHDVLNWSFDLAKMDCEGASDDNFTCTMVDLRPVFAGHENSGVGGWIAGDDIHPNTAGMDAMGETIWSAMKELCIGQSEASGDGCCVP